MRTKLRSKFTLLFVAFGLLLAIPAIALADNIQDNIQDNVTSSLQLTAGDANSDKTAEIRVIGNNSAGDPDNGCNFDTLAESLTITFNTPPGVTATALDGATATPGQMKIAACGVDHTVQFSASSSAAAGNYTVTANVVNNATNGTFVNQVSIPITVNAPAKQDQSISFAPNTPTSKTFGDANFNVSATATSGLTVSYAAKAGSSCTVSSVGLVSLTGAGTCTVVASQSGNTNYNAAPNVEHAISVGKATPTITWSTPTAITYGTALSATQLNAQANVPGSFAYNPNAGTILSAAGSPHTLSTTFTLTNTTDYNNANAQVQLVVNKANQDTLVLTAPASMTYDQAPQTLSTTGGSGTGAVSYSVGTSTGCSIVNGDQLTVSNASGTCSVTATKAADDNYSSKDSAAESVTLNKAEQAALTVLSPDSGTYGDKLVPSASGGTGTGALSFTAAGTACEMGTGTDADKLVITDGTGTCSVTAHKAGNDNYLAKSSAAHPVTVSKREVTVTAEAKNKVYGEDDPALTYEVTNGSVINGDQFTGELSRAPGANVGSYAIQQGTLALPLSKYTLNYVGADLTITVRPITVTPDAGQSKVYGEDDPDLTYQVTSPVGPPALVGSDELTGALSRAPGTNVGSYEIGLGSLSASSNYDLNLSSDAVDFVITARPITVTAVTDSKTYDGTTSSNGTPNVTGGIVSGDTADFSQSFDDKNAGTGKMLTASGSVDDGNSGNNYQVDFVPNNTGEITPATLAINADNQSKVYGNADPSPLTWSLSGFVQGENAGNVTINGDASCSISAPSNVGVHTNAITCAPGNLSSQNYDFETGTKGTLTITERPITVTADAKSKTYGDADPALTYEITSGSLVGSDNLTGSLTRAPGTNVGSYAIQQGTLEASSNYILTYAGADLTIDPRPITVTAVAKNKLFGDPDPALTYQVSGGPLVGTDSFTGALSRDPGEAVGQYNILLGSVKVSDGNNGNNYAINYNGAKLTIGAWTLKGFYQPVDMGIINNAKAGSTVPLKFEVFKGATELTNVSDVKQSFTQKINCASGTGDDIETYSSGNTTLRYDTTGGQFIFNWQTPKAAGSCYRVTLTTLDGSQISADFRLR
jgi:hypothetical protein